jgi:cobalt-zinc-cadmium efflux system protein
MSHVLRLAFAAGLMLAFAGLEYLVGTTTGLFILMADAVNMLTHSGVLLLALVFSVVTQLTGDTTRRYEGIGALLSSFLMMGMGVSVALSGMGHHHHHMSGSDICGNAGLILTAFSVASFVLHSFTTWFLYRSCHANVNVLGACLHMGVHTGMTVVMAISGLLMQVFHWHWLDGALVYALAVVMIFAGASLGKKATYLILYGKLPS